MTKTSDEAPLPAWFDQGKHLLTTRGTYERETGLQVADDGLPANAAMRAQRLAAAGVATDPLSICGDELIASYAPVDLNTGATLEASARKRPEAAGKAVARQEPTDAE